MKKIIVLCLFLSLQLIHAGNIFEYTLDKSEKLEGTYTAEIGNNQTIHFVIIKNSELKKFLLMPFFVDKDKHVQKMEVFVSKKLFSIISYHCANGIATIINYDSDSKQIQYIDYDLSTGKQKSVLREMNESPNNVFRLRDKTVLVSFDKKKNAVNVETVTDSDHIVESVITIPKDKLKFFSTLAEETPDAINQAEFVEKGSIKARKAYLLDNNLVFTLEKNKEELQVYNFNLNTNNDFTYGTINTGFAKESKDVSNYLYDNKIVFLSVEKKDIRLKAFDISTLKETNTLSLTNDMANTLNSGMIETYIKTALKSTVKSTITINKSKSGNLIFRLDNVDSASYNYNYNWYFQTWMFQQQQMMMQQQMMQNMARAPRGFGPSETNDPKIVLSENKENLASLQFVLGTDFKIAPQKDDEPAYSHMNKDKYLDKYKDDKTLKNLTSGFTEFDMRYISINPKTKTISIAFDNL
jgi:hypothetical protein